MNKQGFFSEIWRRIRAGYAVTKVFFQLKWDGLRLSFAIYMANTLQKARNKRFYVLENANGKLIWLCNTDIKEMQKPKKVRKLINGKLRTFKFWMLDPKKTHLDVMRDCLYYTQESWNNKDGLSAAERIAKRKNWIKYMEKIRMDRIYGKLRLK